MGAAVSIDREEATTVTDEYRGTAFSPACSGVSSHTTEAHIALTDFTVLRTPDSTLRSFLPYVWPVYRSRRNPLQIPTG